MNVSIQQFQPMSLDGMPFGFQPNMVSKLGFTGPSPVRSAARLATLKFIPKAEMEAKGYGAYLDQVEEI